MKYKAAIVICTLFAVTFLVAGCGKMSELLPESSKNQAQGDVAERNSKNLENDLIAVTLSSEIEELERGLLAVQFDGDYGFKEYLEQGGASSDADVAAFLTEYLTGKADSFFFGGNPFGCSTISVQNESGEWMFGRNFDWNQCNAMIVKSVPESGYASVSTVNTDFIQGISFEKFPDEIKAAVALYAPLDGMNEKGLAVSVNMIQDNDTIDQDTDKPDLTTTTAVRLLLNQAATTQEAIELLRKYDMHASMNYMVHFAIADADGDSVVVEYVDHEMIVTRTPVVTNFYMAEGEKNGIGTAQSHTRYEMLTEALKQNENMSADEVRDALSSVSKGNFGEFESTEWSVIFNQSTGEVRYYHREDYETGYTLQIEQR